MTNDKGVHKNSDFHDRSFCLFKRLIGLIVQILTENNGKIRQFILYLGELLFERHFTMKHLLIIDNHDSFTYNLVDLVRRLQVPTTVVNVESLVLDEIEPFSHILISPGPDVPRAYPQLFAMLARYYQQKSILGVCLGHQALCEFFGGTLYNLPVSRHGVMETLKLQSNSGLFCGLPSQFQIGLYHSWAISTQNFPDCLRITATCSDEIIMAIQHHSLPIFAVQFHPESFMSEYGEQILRNWLEI